MGQKKQNLDITFIKNKTISYIRSFRLSFWFLISVFFLLGQWLSSQFFQYKISIIILLSLMGIFSSGAMINNAFDKKIDIFARKPIVKIFQYISVNEMIFSSVIISIISLLLLYFFINISTFFLGLIIVVIGILYSTPPIQLKTKPPFDFLMNALGGSIPFFMGWMVNLENLTQESYLYGLIIFFMILHTFFFFTIIDIKSDKEMGIKTSCTILGERKSMIVGVIFFIISLLTSFYYFGTYDIMTISIFACIPIIFSAFIVINNKLYVSLIFGGRCISIFAGSILALLSFYSKDILPILFFCLWMILTAIDISRFFKIRKIG